MIARMYFLAFLTSLIILPLPTSAMEMCAQVIQYAQNSTKSECQAFPTPCDVPSGWSPVKECTLPLKEYKKPKFEVQKFASCEDMEKKVVNILERYQSRYWYPNMYVRDGVPSFGNSVTTSFASEKSVSIPVPSSPRISDVGGSISISTTNIQMLGVDEADTVKTDGQNLYTYSEESHEIRIVRASDLTLQNTIKFPEGFSSLQLYIVDGKLVVVGQKYSQLGNMYTARWYAPEMKSFIAIYRINDPKIPILERYSQIDGSYRDSRVVNNTVYLISTSDFRIPPVYLTRYSSQKEAMAKTIGDIEKNFNIKTFAPEIRESNLGIKGKYIQNIRSSAANCKDVTFVLPDANTLKNIEFNPTLISLSSLDLSNATAKMKSELLFGDVSQIHMSQSSLYITSTISQSSPSTCPPNAKCFAPSYMSASSTLVHRYALKNGGLMYQYTSSVLGNPMNQYSMDEDANGNFRIVTQNYAWSSAKNQNTTEVSIISPSGKVIGKLENIALGENFQSARFIADRLYLVTFEQIDPLFVISLADPRSPKILGELKIPGYSTYLHPYDSDRLIGLGYDTKVNQWGGTQNGGLKVDLYNVADVKNPKQDATLTLGDAGSSSEVLTNPRAFVWYKEKKLLLLPMTLMKSANDKNDTYRSSSAFQGIIGLSILPNSINEKFRISHITLDSTLEKKWKDECAKYTSTGKPVCQRLLDGSDYCPSSSSYVPPYCYAGSTVETYFASQIWNYSRDFITRALYIGDRFYSIAESGVKSWDFANTLNPKASVSFASNPVKTRVYPVPMMAR